MDSHEKIHFYQIIEQILDQKTIGGIVSELKYSLY